MEHVVNAHCEVLLCGGAYNSPQLLMLSGIGDSTELARVGVGLVHSLPAVGRGLANHLQLYMSFEARRPECAMRVGAWGEAVGEGTNDSNQMIEHMKQQWCKSRTGAGCLPDYRTRLCIRTNPQSSDAHPNLQFFALPSQLVARAYWKRSVESAFTVVFNNLRPKSVGHVGLHTASAADDPFVRQNHLDPDYPEDLKEQIEGVKFARHMFFCTARTLESGGRRTEARSPCEQRRCTRRICSRGTVYFGSLFLLYCIQLNNTSVINKEHSTCFIRIIPCCIGGSRHKNLGKGEIS